MLRLPKRLKDSQCVDMHLEYERRHIRGRRGLAHCLAQNANITILPPRVLGKVFDLIYKIDYMDNTGERGEGIEDVYKMESLRSLYSRADFFPDEFSEHFSVLLA